MRRRRPPVAHAGAGEDLRDGREALQETAPGRAATAPTDLEAPDPCLRGDDRATRMRSEKLAAVGLLAAGVMHEINNPLSAILAYAQLLLKGELTARQRADLERIAAEALRASRIVQNLLTFARPMRPQKSATNVNRAVESALELRQHELDRDGVAVSALLRPGLPPVEADPNQLQQVFINIINNAHDAVLDQGGGDARLTIATHAHDGHVCVTFDDNGPGIPQDCLGRIFDPFFTTKEAGRGTGLGLAVCHGIIREHGGRISALNLPGAGARFVVELPAAAQEAS